MSRSRIHGNILAGEQPADCATASLGPGDSSDSGSDMMGISDSAGGDPALPTDVALRDERPPLAPSADALTTANDAAGTGERRSAGADGGKPDGWDIGVDRVITPGNKEDPNEDPNLAFTDEADPDDALIEDEGEDAEGEDPDAERRPRP